MNPMDRVRIWWACARYNFWLDLYFVRRKHRRGLRHDLKGNLTVATNHIGVSQALANIGGVRRLAAETSRGGQLRSSWYAGTIAAATAFACLVFLIFLVSLYYMEGVMDSGVTEPVSSSLWPFFGSTIEVHDQGSGRGVSISLSPGFMPIVVAAVVLVIVAKPWRTWRRSRDGSPAVTPTQT